MFLAAGDNESTFWIQLLVVVILAVSWGLYSLVKTRTRRQAGQRRYYTVSKGLLERMRGLAEVARAEISRRIENLARKIPSREAANNAALELADDIPVKPSVKASRKRRDLIGGMELLGRDFLVGIVEQTGVTDRQIIEMQKICFNELLRRVELWSVASNALKVYTLDEGGFYGKIIRCEAMKELAARTGRTLNEPEDEATVVAGSEING